MQAARLDHPAPIADGPLQVVELADPEPGPGEILLEVTACGVCRTDLQITEGDLAARRLPIIPGHQVVGRVLAVGPGVEGWEAGDRVGVAWLAGTCGECRFCASGRENLCERASFTGWDLDGGYATRMVARAEFAHRLPAGRTDVQLAPLLCGGVIGYRALRVSGIEPGGRLGLFGFGASALLALQVAKHWGCEVAVVTRAASGRQRALEMGADWAGGYDDQLPWPLDAAITFAPAGDVVVSALEAVDRGGRVAINAIHLDRIPSFDYQLLWWERSLISVANVTREDARRLLELAAEIPLETLVDPYPLAEANQALADLARGDVEGSAVITLS